MEHLEKLLRTDTHILTELSKHGIKKEFNIPLNKIKITHNSWLNSDQNCCNIEFRGIDNETETIISEKSKWTEYTGFENGTHGHEYILNIKKLNKDQLIFLVNYVTSH